MTVAVAELEQHAGAVARVLLVWEERAAAFVAQDVPPDILDQPLPAVTAECGCKDDLTGDFPTEDAADAAAATAACGRQNVAHSLPSWDSVAH